MTSQLNVDTIVDKAGSGGSNIGSDDSFATGFISDGAVPLSSRMDYQFRNYDTVVATDQDFQRVMTHGDLA